MRVLLFMTALVLMCGSACAQGLGGAIDCAICRLQCGAAPPVCCNVETTTTTIPTTTTTSLPLLPTDTVMLVTLAPPVCLVGGDRRVPGQRVFRCCSIYALP